MHHPWTIRLVQAGKLETREHEGKTWRTAIYKYLLGGPVELRPDGIAGDENTGAVRDMDRAVCIHPLAHYHFWRAYYRREIPDGFFGENLTVDGLLDEDVCVGDVIRCGTALIQLTEPRTPCYKQDRKLGVSGFTRLLLQTGKIGFLARVLEPGTLQAGDAFELIARPHPEANMVYVNRAFYMRNNPEAARELAALEPLAHDWKAHFVAASRKS
jgi:MOSC domain-containing protein YiiM